MLARILAIGSLVLLVAHFTGSMAILLGALDIGIDTSHIIYLLAMPSICILGLFLLRDNPN